MTQSSKLLFESPHIVTVSQTNPVPSNTHYKYITSCWLVKPVKSPAGAILYHYLPNDGWLAGSFSSDYEGEFVQSKWIFSQYHS